MTGEDLLSTLKPYFTDGLSVNDIDKISVLHDIFEKTFSRMESQLMVKNSKSSHISIMEATRTGFLLIMSHSMRNLFILSLEA